MTNELNASRSPYLRQHADNPVHWREWGPDALADAVARDVPILLSVGYAACHWCHVMAHESFDDPDLAAQMNDGFVCIKVDREERPDIDAVYMNATVAMTGQGGWPMTCFLTPDGDPFYCGTYFPPIGRGGMPGFGQVLAAVTDTWARRRDEVIEMGVKVREHLNVNNSALPTADSSVDDALAAHAVTAVAADEDRVDGGFGGAPKFPPSALLEGLLRHGERTGDDLSWQMVRRTCDAMARGGIYDQLAGGFARYAVDNDWAVPHFEKMLYDNAQLLRVYAHLARRTGDPTARRVTEETVAFLERDLSEGDAFISSLDADAAGVEGSTYVWTPEQLVDSLGEDDGRWAAEVFGVGTRGTVEHGASTLRLRTDPDDAARFAEVRRRLLDVRTTRPQPDRDDKVVTAWNAMTVTALAEAGAGLGISRYLDRAERCAQYLLEHHLVDAELRRSSLDGVAGEPRGGLDDHAAFVTALLTLHQVTGDIGWRTAALDLLDVTLAVFADPDEPGAFFDSAGSALIARPRDPVDGATPSGGSLLAEALLLGSLLAPSEAATRYADLLDATCARSAVLLEKLPRSAGHWLAVTEARLAGPIQIAVAEIPGSTGALAAAARRTAPGGAVVVAGAQDALPLLDDRGPLDGADAAYVCRGSVCGLPVTTAEALSASVD